LVTIGVGQQREVTRALDSGAQLALVAGLGAGDARRDDLAVLADEVLQQIDVLVIDPLDLLRGEAAKLAALEQRAAAVATASVLPACTTTTSTRCGHVVLLP